MMTAPGCGGILACLPPRKDQAVEQPAPLTKPGPAGKKREQSAERDVGQPSDHHCMPQKHRHQIAMMVLRSSNPVSAGFGPDRVGFVPSAAIAASSASTSSTKTSTSLKASHKAGEVFAVLTAVPRCCWLDNPENWRRPQT
jgi:hypothetical protein